ncbi:MAG: DUF6116 family protein [Thermoanaerobaculia bacterium]
MSTPTKSLLTQLVDRFAPRLRFPQLFALTATLFLLDLVIPDLIPFVDEILLGLATLLLGSMKASPQPPVKAADKPPTKDVTPPTQ